MDEQMMDGPQGPEGADRQGPSRRTIIAGAAWTIPVISLASATPAMAASVTPTLEFTLPTYSGERCGTITGVQARATTDGSAPAAGQSVTVTLSDGYTFADGSTTYTGVTDGSGLVTLPDIVVPAAGGNSTFTATGNGLTTTAPVTAPTAGGALFDRSGSVVTTTPNGLPIVDATAWVSADGTRWGGVLTSDGSIWHYNYDTGRWTGAGRIPGATSYDYNGDGGQAVGVIAGGNTLYNRDGSVAATTPNGLTIVDATAWVGADGTRWGGVLTSDGSIWHYNYDTGRWTGAGRIPGASFYAYDRGGRQAGIIAGGTSLFNRDGSVVTTTPNGLSIIDATAWVGADGVRWAGVLTSDGSIWHYNYDTGRWTGAGRIPNAEFYDYDFGRVGIIAGPEPC